MIYFLYTHEKSGEEEFHKVKPSGYFLSMSCCRSKLQLLDLKEIRLAIISFDNSVSIALFSQQYNSYEFPTFPVIMDKYMKQVVGLRK